MFVSLSKAVGKHGGFRIGIGKRITAKNWWWILFALLFVLMWQMIKLVFIFYAWLFYAIFYGIRWCFRKIKEAIKKKKDSAFEEISNNP